MHSRLDISKYLLSLYEDDPEEFMHRVVTQDETWVCCDTKETWVHNFDTEARVISGSTLVSRLRNLSVFFSAGKAMASIFWDSRTISWWKIAR